MCIDSHIHFFRSSSVFTTFECKNICRHFIFSCHSAMVAAVAVAAEKLVVLCAFTLGENDFLPCSLCQFSFTHHMLHICFGCHLSVMIFRISLPTVIIVLLVVVVRCIHSLSHRIVSFLFFLSLSLSLYCHLIVIGAIESMPEKNERRNPIASPFCYNPSQRHYYLAHFGKFITIHSKWHPMILCKGARANE